MERVDISDQLTDKFFEDAKKGKILGFKKDGILKHYKIVRLNKSRKICVVVETNLHNLQEADEILKETMTLEDVLKRFEESDLSTTQDVIDVLTFIAPPGKKQELKREAIAELFKGQSIQGFKVVDSIESYEEF